MNLISLEFTFWDRQCQSNWVTRKEEEFLSSTLKGDSGIHWQTSRDFFSLIFIVFYILRSMVRESSFTTGKFLSRSDQTDEGKQNWQNLSNSQAINFKTHQKYPFQFRCSAVSNTWKQEFSVSNQLLCYLLNYWLPSLSHKFYVFRIVLLWSSHEFCRIK